MKHYRSMLNTLLVMAVTDLLVAAALLFQSTCDGGCTEIQYAVVGVINTVLGCMLCALAAIGALFIFENL